MNYQQITQLKSISVGLLLFLLFSSQLSMAQSTREVLNKMVTAIDNAQTLEYSFKKKERLKDGNWSTAELKAKLSTSPLKIRMDLIKPKRARSLTYVEGENNNKVIVDPGRLIPNFKVSPTSNILIKDQHRNIKDSGFDLIKNLVSAGIKRADAQNGFDELFKITGSKTYDAQDCHVVQITDPTFSFKSYTVKKGENLIKIAQKNKVSEYMILEKNKGVDDYFDVKAGQEIQIPTSFAPKITFYVSKTTHLPLFTKIEDNKGLFEQYEFFDVKVNPELTWN